MQVWAAAICLGQLQLETTPFVEVLAEHMLIHWHVYENVISAYKQEFNWKMLDWNCFISLCSTHVVHIPPQKVIFVYYCVHVNALSIQ